MPKYRYMGMKGIFIGDKHYHNQDIVETKKPIEELGFDPLLFKKLTEKKETEIKSKINLELKPKLKIKTIRGE